MRIAYYAPLKAPDDDLPSGDRLMARQLITVLETLGHEVRLTSRLRAWLRKPGDLPAVRAAAAREVDAIERQLASWRPDIWFTYHLYYRAPDFLGPTLSRRREIPYLAAEASFAPRRAEGPWAEAQGHAMEGLTQAALLFAMTRRDADGLARCPGVQAPIVMLAPFLADGGLAMDPSPVRVAADPRAPCRLVTVAMMRTGGKLASYRLLARALRLLADRPWRLTIVGDGPERHAVRDAFAGFGENRILWRGQIGEAGVRDALDDADLFVWPGHREPYGMVYLEAQARGLPVAAMDSAGVSTVVADGVSGLLTPDGDVEAYSRCIRALVDDSALRRALAGNARNKVLATHSESAARRVLASGLAAAIARGAAP